MKNLKNKIIFISNPTNVYYFTGFRGVHTRDGFAILTPKSNYLITNSMYFEQAEKLESIKTGKVKLEVISREKGLLDITKKIIGQEDTIYFEADDVTVEEHKRMKSRLKVKMKPIKSEIKDMRSLKSKNEIELIKQAVEITRKSIAQLKDFIITNSNSNITELDAVEELRKISSNLGGNGFGFDPIVAFDANSAMPHHSSGKTQLKADSVVLLDIGIKYKEYSGDLTETFCLTKNNQEFNKVYKVVDECRNVCIQAIKPGATFRSVDDKAIEFFKAHALDKYFIHSIGHGLGLEIHEEPHISEAKLKAGMIITIEPGIYLPGKFGVRLESDIVVTQSGYEIF